MLTVGDLFPQFQLTAVKAGPDGLSGPETSFFEISNDSDSNQWKVYFFWPKDFTFICPTEIKAFSDLVIDFSERDTLVYGISTDSEFVHLNWRLHHPELNELFIPMLSDINRELSSALGILDKKEGIALRATFIVDSDNIIQWVEVNALSVGRNPKEVLRVLDALQTESLCPCSWTKGQATLSPDKLVKQSI